ncbi:MAG: plastocyanin/azurin family copper-binding protein [Gammaproteobacteria bacterium]
MRHVALTLLLALVTACSQEQGEAPGPQPSSSTTSGAARDDAAVVVDAADQEPPAAAAPGQDPGASMMAADDTAGGTSASGAATTAATASGADSDGASTAAARAPERHEIRGVVTQWQPMITFVQPGDQIVFLQMAGHDTEAIAELIPAAAEPWKSAMGEEGFSVVLDAPGAYIYKCNPHVSTGMVGVIVVGDGAPSNRADLEASPLNKGMIGRAIRKLGAALDAP